MEATVDFSMSQPEISRLRFNSPYDDSDEEVTGGDISFHLNVTIQKPKVNDDKSSCWVRLDVSSESADDKKMYSIVASVLSKITSAADTSEETFRGFAMKFAAVDMYAYLRSIISLISASGSHVSFYLPAINFSDSDMWNIDQKADDNEQDNDGATKEQTD